MKKVVCIGNAVYDITYIVDEFMTENTKVRAKQKLECKGGAAANAAHLLSSFGADTYFVGVVGNDLYGKKIIEELKSANVNINYMEINNDYNTPISSIIVNQENKTRTTICYKDPNMKISKKVKIDADVILIDGQEYEASFDIIRSNNAISIIDANRVNDQILNLCKEVNYIITSKEFAENFTNLKFDSNDKQSYENIIRRIQNEFPNKHYVITLEDEGCMYIDNNDEIKYIPTFNVDVKDPTGAGDFFHGAFAYAMANNYSFEDALSFSNITATLSTTKFGSSNSIPKLDEVLNIYEK